MAGVMEDGALISHEPIRRPRWRRRPGTLIASAAIVAALCAASARPAGAVEAGIVMTSPTPSQIASDKALGTHWVRLFATWPDLEPARGVTSTSWLHNYEVAFQQLPAGTKVLLDVVLTPRWETGSSDERTPPANPHDYAAFVAMLARHFGSHVAAYEIWNEEDEPRWWVGAPDPAAYVRLLQAAYPAIKAAEPNAQVIVGGLTGNDYKFVEGIYQNGGKGYFDAIGTHTDTSCDIAAPSEFLRGEDGRMLPDSFLAYREVHAVMLANGDEKPIWMTEASWRATGAVCPEGYWKGRKAEGVTAQQQAAFLGQAYHCMAQDPYLKVALWFPLQDENGVLSGLVASDGSRKAAFDAMRNYAAVGDLLNEPCGTFTGPDIKVVSPTANHSYNGPLNIHIVAADSMGVWRIRLEYDGKLFRNFDDTSYPTTLTGVIEWQGAKHIPLGWHTLTISAYDKQHTSSVVRINVFHGARSTMRHHTGGSGAGAGANPGELRGAGAGNKNAKHRTAKHKKARHKRARHRRAHHRLRHR